MITIQNPFSICIRNWQVNTSTAVFLLVLTLLSSCTEEPTNLGFDKDVSRIGMFYKEFNLPATTVQADSLRSDNVRIFIDEPIDVNLDRLMAGNVSDPYFGNIDAELYMQFMPPTVNARIKRQNVTLRKVTMTLLLDYYFYGDTSVNAPQTFEVRKIGRRGMDADQKFFTSSELTLDDPVLGTTTWQFNADSVQKRISLNTDNNKNNNVLDTLSFDLDNSFGQKLLDSVLTIKDTLDDFSIANFKRAFRGVGVTPVNNSVVMGFNAGNYTSRITVYYNYVENSQPKIGKYVFVFGSPYCQSFTQIRKNRNSTSLAGLTQKYTPYTSPDGYSYVQSGTGLFARLDLSDFHSYFDTIANPLINSAELIIQTPTKTERSHYIRPKKLYFMFVAPNERFFRPVYVSTTTSGATVEKIDPAFQPLYHALLEENFEAFAKGDDSYALEIPYVENTEGTFYRTFMSQWFQYQLRLPEIYPKITKAALIPSETPFGKSLSGFSFRSDQVKLKVYYSKALLKN